jgi:DNA-directed RNA polymerase subunit RPC12/RpoP
MLSQTLQLLRKTNLWKRLKAEQVSHLGKWNVMERTPAGIVYECVRCGAKVPSEELEMRGGETKCIICGYRILRKIKPPVVKRIPAK